MAMITKSDIALVRSLGDKKGRAERGLFVVEGEKLVGELLGSGISVDRLYATERFGGRAERLIREIPGGDRPVVERVSEQEMERLSHLKTHTPVLALARIPRYDLPEEPGRELTLALDGVQDPGNMGTIIRLADWFGIRDILCSPATADCFNPKVVQATMGSILRVRVHYTHLRRVLEHAAAHTEEVYGTFLEGENIYRADLGVRPSGIIVMGSEGRGVTPPIAEIVTRRLYIPPYRADTTTSESLNVATATAIVCAEFRRRMQR